MTQSVELPPGVVKYAESPVFSSATVPEKLTSKHNLKSDVWGRPCVDAGSVEYHALAPSSWTVTASAGESIVIEPLQEHFVRPSDDAIFQVEFYRRFHT
uniref:DUF1971 domain-containing protein n=1 Tax=Parerythrobacter lutipelagi TaxID=1964208 RepID=UPI0013757789